MADEKKNGADAGPGLVTLSATALAEIIKTSTREAVREALAAVAPHRFDELETQMATDRRQTEARAKIQPIASVVLAGSKAYAEPLTLTLISHQAWHEGKNKILSGNLGGQKIQTRFGEAFGRKHAFAEHLELEATATALRNRYAAEVTSAVQKQGRLSDPVPVEVALGIVKDDPKRWPLTAHWTKPELLQ